MKITIRKEKESDYLEIGKVNDLAFGQVNEGLLIQKLRNHPDFIPELSLVAISGHQLVGHILFFPVAIANKNRTHSVLSLGPMAILPGWQNKMIGSQLVNYGLDISRKNNFIGVVVLGHEHYYPRFGFKPASAWNIRPPFDVPDGVFMAIELKKNSLQPVSGTVIYPDAFNDV